MTIPETCPHCGAERDEIHANPHYICESGDEGHGIEQSDLCRTRCELAALRTRHQRLVEAARKAANQYSCELVEDCDCLMCSLYKIVKEEQALESEESNA